MVENPSWRETVFEELAAIEHQRWADWQSYLHNKLIPVEAGTGEIVGYMMSLADYRRWDRQIRTDYADLSEQEKESDREQVRRYWHLIEADIPLEAPETAQDAPEAQEELPEDLAAFRDRLRALFDGMAALLVSKRQAYGTNNLIRRGHKGIAIRMSDKIDRLENLTDAQAETSADGESVIDAYRDLIGYAALGILLWEDDHAAKTSADYKVTLDFGPLLAFAQNLGEMLRVHPNRDAEREYESHFANAPSYDDAVAFLQGEPVANDTEEDPPEKYYPIRG